MVGTGQGALRKLAYSEAASQTQHQRMNEKAGKPVMLIIFHSHKSGIDWECASKSSTVTCDLLELRLKHKQCI